MNSIRAKLLLFSLFLVVVPGILIGLTAFAGVRRLMQSSVGRQLAEVAHDTSIRMEGALNRELHNVESWARHEPIRALMRGDADGALSRFLTARKEEDGNYLDLLSTDVSGTVVAASDPAYIGSSVGDSDWWRATGNGETFLEGPVRWPRYAHRVIEIAAPVHNRRGRWIGSLLGLYDWERQSAALVDQVQEDLLPLRMRVGVLILDGRGVVIAESPQPSLPEFVGTNLREAGWRAVQPPLPSGRPGFVHEPRLDALVGYARLEEPQPAWSALITQPLDFSLRPVRRMERKIALALSGVLLGAFGIAFVLAERMGNPLRELTRATREIAERGEMRGPLAVRSRDEIGELATAFNKMVADLRLAQDRLVEAARFALLGEIAAGVAHEVRTPLGSMRSSAQILRRSLSPDRPENAELLDIIIAEVDRLDGLVTELLELAAPHEPSFEATPLAPILDRAVDFVAPEARARGISIRRDFARGLPPVRIDAEQIYRAALNLVVNALQVLPHGGEICVRTLAAPGGRIAFEVSDDGPGMTEEIRARIFTPFFTTRGGGTGLGLALVQRAVQVHQGSVSVESAVGRGSTFRVELPVVEERR